MKKRLKRSICSTKPLSKRALRAERKHCVATALWLATIIGLSASLCATEQAQASKQEAYAFTLENDIFTGSDDRYTNGMGISWLSDSLDKYSEDTKTKKIFNLMSFLPGIRKDKRFNFFSWSFSQEMHTPEDTTLQTPDPNDQPYAGFLLSDLSVFSYHSNWAQMWTIRLGLVGPSALAGEAQTELHRLLGNDLPQGWDSQIKDEPVINLNYGIGRKILDRRLFSELSLRLTPMTGLELGSYSTGLYGGLLLEVGWNTSQTISVCSIGNGMNIACGVGNPNQKRWSVTAYAVSAYYRSFHFMPLDGPVFRRGPSAGADIDPMFAFTNFGIVVRKSRYSIIFGIARGTSPADNFAPELDFASSTFIVNY